jgi:cytochrome c5
MTSLIKTPRQLITIVLVAFAVPIVVGVLVSQLVTSGEKGMDKNDSKVQERIQPVGEVVLADAGGPKGALTGEQVYGQVCKTCHDAGLAGAPKLGDKGTWSARIAAGEKTLDQHAIAGFKAMPAKGGNADLTDDEVGRAVVYMANKSGASWKVLAVAPPAVASASAQTAAAAPVAATAAPVATTSAQVVATSAAPSAATSAAAGKADGKRVFESTCTVCHGAGLAGAPKVGDKAAWAPRIAQGINVLYAHAIGGLTGKGGVMPPKGGNLALSDPDVKAAVDFMVAASK